MHTIITQWWAGLAWMGVGGCPAWVPCAEARHRGDGRQDVAAVHVDAEEVERLRGRRQRCRSCIHCARRLRAVVRECC